MNVTAFDIAVKRNAPAECHDFVRKIHRPIELVRTQDDRCPCSCCVTNKCIDDVATFFVETSVWLVEQPEFRATSEQTRKRSTSPLTRRQTTDSNITQTPIKTEASHSGVGVGDVGARRLGPEADIVLNGEFVIETGAMRQQANAMPNRAPIFPKVDTQNDGLARGDRH